MAALIADNVDPREMGVAGGMNTVVRMIGAVIGGQVGAALLTAQTIGSTSVPAESAFTTAFALSAVTALVAAAHRGLDRRAAPCAGASPRSTPRSSASSARTSPVRSPGRHEFARRADAQTPLATAA